MSPIPLYTLSTKEEQELQKIINDVLKTPAMSRMKFGTFQGTSPEAQGAILMEDAQGNRAWRYPDGRIEETK